MFGLRTGFFLGFMAGAAIASLFTESERNERPVTGEAADDTRGSSRLKSLMRDAMASAREAAREKENEMRRQFEAATHRQRFYRGQ